MAQHLSGQLQSVWTREENVSLQGLRCVCTPLGPGFPQGSLLLALPVCLWLQERIKVSMVAVGLPLSPHGFVGLLLCLRRLCVYKFRARTFFYLCRPHRAA